MENEYGIFIKNVKSSIDTVLTVARWAVLSGRSVTIPGMAFADNYDEWKKCADNGADIIIDGKSINVKGSSRDFSSVSDFASKFSHYERPILVAASHTNTPNAYLIVNANHTGAMIINGKTKVHWGTRTVRDPRYKTQQTVYDVAEKYVTWLCLRAS